MILIVVPQVTFQILLTIVDILTCEVFRMNWRTVRLG